MAKSNNKFRSTEVQEIIGSMPPFLIRWGITCIFMVIVIVLAMTWFLQYPDVVKGNALITTQIAPLELVLTNVS